jgi:hypothetical protein
VGGGKTKSKSVLEEKSKGANRREELKLKLDEDSKVATGTNPVLDEKPNSVSDEKSKGANRR